MKKLILSFSFTVAALAATAAVESSNTFGVLKVESSTKQTIIAVPWVAVGSGSSNIKVADLVMTSNLTKAGAVEGYAGDMLYYYDPTANEGKGEYKAWVLNASGAWEATASVTANGITPGEAAENQVVPRGHALILVRRTTDQPIYLYGQYTSAAMAQQEMTANAYNLIAPPNTTSTALDLNTGVTWDGVNSADKIKVSLANGNFITLVRDSNNTEWGLYSKGTWSTALSKIQPGTGAWYVAASGSEAKLTFN